MLILQKKNGFGSGDMPTRAFTEVVTLHTFTAAVTSTMDVDSAGNVYFFNAGGTSTIQKYDATTGVITGFGPDWDEWGGSSSWRCSEAYSLVVDNAGTYVYLWKANLGGSNCSKPLYNALYRVNVSDGTFVELYKENNTTARTPTSLVMDKDTNSKLYGIKTYGNSEWLVAWDVAGDVATETNDSLVTANGANIIIDKTNNNLFTQDSSVQWQEITLDNIPNVENTGLYGPTTNGRNGHYLYGSDLLWVGYGTVYTMDIIGTNTVLVGGTYDGTTVDGTIASGNVKIGRPIVAQFNKSNGQLVFMERDGSSTYRLRVLR